VQRVFLALSFDHELSLGGVRSYGENLFAPTEALLDTANDLGVKICLFTDILCNLRFKEWDRDGFCVPYERQLRRALCEGHEVQLHLHPHWMDVSFDRGRFVLGQRFSLGDFADGSGTHDLCSILHQGLEELVSVCSGSDHEYRCLAYRAGGHSYGATERQQTSMLWKSGVRIDSSIAKGYYLKTRSTLVNFRRMPVAANWFIEPGGVLTSPAERGLFEVPIASSPRTPVNNLPFLARRIIAKRYRRDSGGIGFHERKDGFCEKLGRLFPQSAWMLSFDGFTDTPARLLGILRTHLRRHATDEEIYCSAISHPKSMGAYQLRLFRDFVSMARQSFGSALSITSFREIARLKGMI